MEIQKYQTYLKKEKQKQKRTRGVEIHRNIGIARHQKVNMSTSKTRKSDGGTQVRQMKIHWGAINE